MSREADRKRATKARIARLRERVRHEMSIKSVIDMGNVLLGILDLLDDEL